MSIKLIITLILFSLFLIFLTTYTLKKNRISVKNSILWYCFSIMILILGVFPKIFVKISNFLGYEKMSNFIISVIVGLLILLNIVLSIMISGQREKTTLLIQEISLLKKDIKNLKDNNIKK